MTISTSRGTQRTVSDLVRRAWQLPGLMNINEGTSGPTWTAKAAAGRAFLDIILDGLQAEAPYAKQVDFEYITLADGDFDISISDNILDIEGDGMYISADETDLTKASSETLVKQVDRETWHTLSAKSAEGRPSLFYYHRPDQELWFWPIPDEAGTVRVQAHKFMTDADSGDVTLELRPYWDTYLIWELGSYIALSQGLDAQTVKLLESKAKRQKDIAKAFANQHVSTSMVVDHPTPWSGRR